MRVDATGAALDGVETDIVTCAIGTSISATVAVFVGAGTARVVLRDGADTAIQVKNAVSANALSSVVGPLGNNWYIFHVSGTNAAANAKLSIDSADGNGIFYIDNAYLQIGTTTAPKAWASSAALKNRYDPAATTAATRQQINYLDVWGVPGDAPALVKNTITIPAVSRSTIIASRHTSGVYDATAVRSWIESDEFTTTAGTGAWSDVVDAARTDAHYTRYTEKAGAGPYSAARATILMTGSTARAFAKAPRRVFGILRASTVDIKFLLLSGIAGVNLSNPKTATGVSVSAINTWEFVDLGIINAKGLLPDVVTTDADQEVSVSVQVSGTSASSTCDIDALMIFVAQDEFAIWVGVEDTKAAGGNIIFDGTEKAVISEGSAIYESALGGLWYLHPNVTNRLLLAIAGTDDAHVLADTLTLSLFIIPRTSHLLGTV
jgi:hypothetical protein